jgi:hypothetical protein
LDDGGDAIVLEQSITCRGNEDMVQHVKRRGQPKGSHNRGAPKCTMENEAIAPSLMPFASTQSSPHNPFVDSPARVNHPVPLGNSDFLHCGLEWAM